MAWIKFYPLKIRDTRPENIWVEVTYPGDDKEFDKTIDDRMKKDNLIRVRGSLRTSYETRLVYHASFFLREITGFGE